MRLAEFYLELLKDEQMAADLLKNAHKLSPGSKEIISELNKLGLRLHKGEWLTDNEMKKLPQDPIKQMMRKGIVVEGMTRAQVRKTLGAPSSTVRIASARQIIEVWIYQNAQYAVRFQSSKQRRGDEPTVVDDYPLPHR
jgi:hypothetical protein